MNNQRIFEYRKNTNGIRNKQSPQSFELDSPLKAQKFQKNEMLEYSNEVVLIQDRSKSRKKKKKLQTLSSTKNELNDNNKKLLSISEILTQMKSSVQDVDPQSSINNNNNEITSITLTKYDRLKSCNNKTDAKKGISRYTQVQNQLDHQIQIKSIENSMSEFKQFTDKSYNQKYQDKMKLTRIELKKMMNKTLGLLSDNQVNQTINLKQTSELQVQPLRTSYASVEIQGKLQPVIILLSGVRGEFSVHLSTLHREPNEFQNQGSYANMNRIIFYSGKGMASNTLPVSSVGNHSNNKNKQTQQKHAINYKFDSQTLYAAFESSEICKLKVQILFGQEQLKRFESNDKEKQSQQQQQKGGTQQQTSEQNNNNVQEGPETYEIKIQNNKMLNEKQRMLQLQIQKLIHDEEAAEKYLYFLQQRKKKSDYEKMQKLKKKLNITTIRDHIYQNIEESKEFSSIKTIRKFQQSRELSERIEKARIKRDFLDQSNREHHFMFMNRWEYMKQQMEYDKIQNKIIRKNMLRNKQWLMQKQLGSVLTILMKQFEKKKKELQIKQKIQESSKKIMKAYKKYVQRKAPDLMERELQIWRQSLNILVVTINDIQVQKAKEIIKYCMCELIGAAKISNAFKKYRFKIMKIQKKIKKNQKIKQDQIRVLKEFFEREKKRMVIQFLKMKDKQFNDLVQVIQVIDDKVRDTLITQYYYKCNEKFTKAFQQFRNQEKQKQGNLVNKKESSQKIHDEEGNEKKYYTHLIWNLQEVDVNLNLTKDQINLAKKIYFYLSKKHTYYTGPMKQKYQSDANKQFFLTSTNDIGNHIQFNQRPFMKYFPEAELMHQLILKAANCKDLSSLKI